MTMKDTIITKLHALPESVLRQVNDFIDLIAKNQSKPNDGSNKLVEVERILRETEGSWGHLSLDEIDARLAQQRQFDWGE